MWPVVTTAQIFPPAPSPSETPSEAHAFPASVDFGGLWADDDGMEEFGLGFLLDEGGQLSPALDDLSFNDLISSPSPPPPPEPTSSGSNSKGSSCTLPAWPSQPPPQSSNQMRQVSAMLQQMQQHQEQLPEAMRATLAKLQVLVQQHSSASSSSSSSSKPQPLSSLWPAAAPNAPPAGAPAEPRALVQWPAGGVVADSRAPNPTSAGGAIPSSSGGILPWGMNPSGVSATGSLAVPTAMPAFRGARGCPPTSGKGRQRSKHQQQQRYSQLVSLLQEKQERVAALERANDSLKRRQRIINSFIKVRDAQLSALGRAASADFANFKEPWAGHPILGIMTFEKIRELESLELWAQSELVRSIMAEAARLLLLTSGPGLSESGQLSSVRGGEDSSVRQTVTTLSTGDLVAPLQDRSRLLSSLLPAALSGPISDALNCSGSSSDIGNSSETLSPEEAKRQLEVLMRGSAEIRRYVEVLKPAMFWRPKNPIPPLQDMPSAAWRNLFALCNLTEDQIQDAAVLADIGGEMRAKVGG